MDKWESDKISSEKNRFAGGYDPFDYTAPPVDEDENATETTDEPEDEPGAGNVDIYEWVQIIVTALICCVLFFIFVGRSIGVEGGSMMDTFVHRDRVFMHNVLYTPKKGDIIVFQSKTEERFHNVPLVKRVIATAGDTIDIDFNTGDVSINGKVIDEDKYIRTVTTNSEGFVGPVTVPDGFVFVMGDNRNHSSDSRGSDVGLVDTRYILGHVVFLLIPGQSDDGGRDWSRFGFVDNQYETFKDVPAP